MLGFVAVLPVAQACIGAFIILESQSEGLSINELLPTLFDTRSGLYEESAAMCISNICRTWLFMEMIDDLFDERVRGPRESWYELIEESRYAEEEKEDNEDRP